MTYYGKDGNEVGAGHEFWEREQSWRGRTINRTIAVIVLGAIIWAVLAALYVVVVFVFLDGQFPWLASSVTP